ncbi:MAG TPA: A/G-specific adenine glycosylase [Candidatus Paceibacterota bacterium]|nr:A/G-specific adenine glycosylase [Candidatus Paceibacterota bacterium]
MPKLLRDLKSFYKTRGRGHLPWRHTHDPYGVLVSEVMLQQTQVDRVVPKYETFIRKFPTAQRLAKAKLSEVLALWQGLGYNRRAKYLHEAAKIIAREGWTGGKLPGVGSYTAAAVEAFAHNKPSVFIETNIRTVFIHYLFRRRSDSLIPDIEILPKVKEALTKSGMEPRDFYAALMDYGSYLKQKGIKLNSRSKHYTKQSKFEGSYRQVRGLILRELLKMPKTFDELIDATGRSSKDLAPIVAVLAKEGLIAAKNRRFRILD